MPNIFTALMSGAGEEEHARLSSNLEEAKKEAELAEKECKEGFPLLHGHALVAMWGALETAIEDMLVGILLNEPTVLKKDAFAKVKVTLSDFETKDKEERMRFLLQELGRSLGRKNGVDAFESLLEHFDLSGPVDEKDRKLMWETNHIRNVIVHRASCADRRLVEACPWLGLKISDPVTVSHEQLGAFAIALCQYATTVTLRLGKRYDVDTDALLRAVGITEPLPLSKPLNSKGKSKSH